MSKKTLGSVGAIVAGALAGIVLSIGTDVMLRTDRIFPAISQPMSDSLLVLATAYRTVYGVAGAYLTARLAPARPMFHALVLGSLGFVVSAIGAVSTWNHVPSLGPHWYPLALVALAIPTAWLSGELRLMQFEEK